MMTFTLEYQFSVQSYEKQIDENFFQKVLPLLMLNLTPSQCKYNITVYIQNIPPSRRRHLYFVIVVGLVWSNNSKDNAGGSVATLGSLPCLTGQT
jgi:hypothetical protein